MPGNQTATVYEDVHTRLLHPSERRITSATDATPLVIEARTERRVEFLRELIASHSEQLLSDVATHGAVLFRGFDVVSDRDFERAMLGGSTFVPMPEVLMSEEGRDVVEGTRHVLHTSTLLRTGGTLFLGSFHSENYYTTDVPAQISFFCRTPSWLGGETGLIDTAKIYADLSPELRDRIEAEATCAMIIPVSQIGARYGLGDEATEQFLAERGIEVVTGRGRRVALIFKPNVLIHPITGERALVTNFGELERHGFDRLLRRAFLSDYEGWPWAVHRLMWRHEQLEPLIELYGIKSRRFLFNWLRQRTTSVRSRFAPRRGDAAPAPPPPADLPTRFRNLIQDDDLPALAASLRRHFSSFAWQPGDILVIDNIKMAHTGMPGAGPRLIRALISNVLRMELGRGPGIASVAHSSGPTMGDAIVAQQSATQRAS